MNRYQMYLEPETADSLDDFAKYLALSRSQIIRDVLDRVAREYRKLLSVRIKQHNENNPLLQMAGCAESPTGTISQNIDEIYRRD